MPRNSAKKYRRRKRTAALRNLMLTLILLLSCIAGGMYFFGDTIRSSASSYITEKAIEQISNEIGQQTGFTADEIQEAVNTLDAEDQEAITAIVDSHLTPETASDITTYVQNNDTDGLLAYAQENLSEEEWAQLYEIYMKYSN